MPLRPEPFLSLLAAGTPARAADLPARTAEELLARAEARVQCGREHEARADLEAALPTLGDVAAAELAWLDIRERGDLEAAHVVLQTIALSAPPGSELAARVRHLLGLAAGKLRRSAEAVQQLVEAAAIYRRRGQPAELAQVHDTLGSVFAAQGRLDHATGHYALALVAKTRANDRWGLAITLGNLGRTYLRAGRAEEALDAFALDLEIARELGDRRGIARMHEDRGRALAAQGDAAGARTELCECLRLSSAEGFRDLEFFAHKDLALLALAAGRVDEAERSLADAERALEGGGEPYLQVLLSAARAECRARAGDPAALAELEAVCERFAEFDLADQEIPALLALAEELVRRERALEAEDVLLRASRRARRDGYARYLPRIREAMGRLALVAPVALESDRAVAGPLAAREGSARLELSEGSDGYLLLAPLGEGGFGQVFKAYDAQRGDLVAFKRIDLSRDYAPEKRVRHLESAQRELEAVSRLRHPGIARVLALGTEPDGSAYVVQEFVAGRSLRSRIPDGPSSDPIEVFEGVRLICLALCEVHAAGIVHRDLKPENILLREPEGLPVLIDFGLAHVPDGGFDERLRAGTLRYMAPEQAQGRAEAESDLYSVGVIVFEWLTGRLPIEMQGRSLSESLQDLRTKAPTPIRSLRPDVPGEVVELLDSLLSKDPADRITALQVAEFCELLLKDLRRACATSAEAHRVPGSTAPAPARARPHGP